MQKHLLTICGLLFTYFVNGQCAFPNGISVPELSCNAGTSLSNNANINTGSVYHFNGTNGNFSNISLGGGTLVLCGSATLSNVNHNSGTIVIKEGASITFSGNYNLGNSQLFNLGSATFNSNMYLQSSSLLVYNAPGATLTVAGQTTYFNSGTFINNGTTGFKDIVINSSGVNICYGPNAVSNARSIQNNGNNVVKVPSGNAYIHYTGQFTGNAPISNTSNLKICPAPGASNPSSTVAGGASVVADCASLGTPLPVKLLSFYGNENTGIVTLAWTSETEDNVKGYAIQKSIDAHVFETIGQTPARNIPSSYQYSLASTGKSYFRLKIIDMDGSITYSRIITVQSAINPGWKLLTNPVYSSYLEISMHVPENKYGELVIIDNVGRIISRKFIRLSRGQHVVSYAIQNIPGGSYYLHFRENNGEIYKPILFIKGTN